MAWQGVEQLFPASSQAPALASGYQLGEASGPDKIPDVTQTSGAISSVCSITPEPESRFLGIYCS